MALWPRIDFAFLCCRFLSLLRIVGFIVTRLDTNVLLISLWDLSSKVLGWQKPRQKYTSRAMPLISFCSRLPRNSRRDAPIRHPARLCLRFIIPYLCFYLDVLDKEKSFTLNYGCVCRKPS